MTDPAGQILWAMALLLFKHAVADYYLQTPYQYQNKGTYGHPGGLIHAGIHAVLTLPVFAILPPANLALAVALPTGEFVVHYHIDWLKEQMNNRHGWTVTTAGYWRSLGADQLAHGLTYVAIAATLVRFG